MELCGRSLNHFTTSLWRYVETSEYVDSQHIKVICDHLEAVKRGEILRLMINIPPRCMKSLSVSVFFPAWCWQDDPELKFLYASYSEALSIRDSVKCRRIIQSPKYELLKRHKKCTWGLTSDQNTKTRFDNTVGGYRVATSVGGMLTGEGGDIIAVDDPHNVMEGESETQRKSSLTWWDEAMSTRLNDPKTGRFILMGQRIHEADLFGHVKSKDKGKWTILTLPMRYSIPRPDDKFALENRCISHLPTEWRTKDDELLWPERFPMDKVEEIEDSLGPYATAAQLQQRPSPRVGGVFEVGKFKITQGVDKSEVVASVRYWDKAGTDGGGAHTSGSLVHKMKEGSFVISNVVTGQWAAPERERAIKQTAEIDGPKVTIWTEQEPGSGGKESAEATVRNLASFKVFMDKVTGSKEVRAEPYACQVAAGNVYLVAGEWNREFIEEHRMFPNGKFKDRVDSTSGAVNKLVVKKASIGAW